MQQQLNRFSLSIDTYNVDKTHLLENLETQAGVLNFYGDNFNPYPIAVEPKQHEQLLSLHQTLIIAIKQIVAHYHSDPDIQRLMPLPPQAKELLALANSQPYQIGTLRPDFIINTNGEIKLCEINARFPLNGLIVSTLLAKYYSSENTKSSTRISDSLVKRFDPTQPIRILKQKEKGYDIHLAHQILQKSPYNLAIEFIHPHELSLQENTLLAKGIACSQYIIELHQDELLSLDKPILQHLVKHCNCLNDIRTILLAHDKRLLSVLSNEDILNKYLCDKSVAILKRHIIPTVPVTPDNTQQILASLNKWVLKKFLSGKMDGMVIGKNASRQEVRQVLQQYPNSYIAQAYVEQQTFNVLTINNATVEVQDKYLVGITLSIDNSLHGAGFFRAATHSVVNVSTQGGEIIPIV